MKNKNEKRYIKKIFEQRILAIVMLVICAVILLMAATASSPSGHDITPVILLAPVSIWMMFTKQLVIC